MVFDLKVLDLNLEGEATRICGFIQSQVFSRYKRKGVVVGLSGGVDSALLACLCVRALGPEKGGWDFVARKGVLPSERGLCK